MKKRRFLLSVMEKQDNAIPSYYKIFFIGFVIDTASDEVADLESTATLDIARRFIRSIF